jgi:hypothetical protein
LIYRKEKTTVMARSVEDGRERLVFSKPDLGQFVVSPDGKWIAHSRTADDRRTEEFRVEALGSGPGSAAVALTARLADLPMLNTWSPGSTHVLINTGVDLVVLDARTGKSWPLANQASVRALFGPEVSWHWEGDAGWAPDGSFVVCAIDVNRRNRVFLEGVTYEAVTRLTKGGPR